LAKSREQPANNHSVPKGWLDVPQSDPTVERERLIALIAYDANARLEAYRQASELHRLQGRGILDFATAAIKSILLINGGAAVAVLTLLGALAGKSIANDGGERQTAALIAAVVPCLSRFVLGVFLAGATAALTYLSQVLFVELKTRESREFWGNATRIVAVLFAGAALFAFICGAYLARDGLTSWAAEQSAGPSAASATAKSAP
jgi:hypothetical protein